MYMSRLGCPDTLTHEQISSFIVNNFDRLEKDTPEGLVHFHSINKYLIMAHNQNDFSLLEQIVANHEKFPIEQIYEQYGEQLEQTLRKPPTIQSHCGVLEKIFAYFKKALNSEEKKIILETISEFKDGNQSLNNVLLQLEEMTRKFNKAFLVRQTYFLLYAKMNS